ncbi:MAG: alpha/beta fold hydrolase [Beijerinckiaceae bacterium]
MRLSVILRAGLCSAIAICCAYPALSSAGAAEVSLPPFYEKAARIAPKGPLGTVVAKEPVATNVPGAIAWRIAYVSSDLQDRPTLSTALVVAPKGPAKGANRPIISWAHGTTGTAQNCGPSQVIDPAQPLNEYFLVGGTSWTDFGLPAINQFIASGYVVVATDYQGLGAGGRHQYAVAGTQGRDAINAIRAAGSMGLSGQSKKAIVYGWSQGGGATIAAASMPDYINRKGTAFDGIDIAGFVAMAPQDVAAPLAGAGADDASAAKALGQITSAFSGDVFNFTHAAMSLWALPSAFPDLKLTDVFTQDGIKAFDAVLSKKCMHAAADTVSFNFADTYKTFMNAQPSNASAWIKALVQGSVAPVKPVAPVVIYWGTKDNAVPPVMHKLYQEQMCKMGANVTRIQLPGEQSHYTTPPMAEPMYVPWVKDRLEGKPLANGCAPT